MEGNFQEVRTICGHIFCQICMEWIKENSKNCPLCNNKYFLPSHLLLAIKHGKLRESEQIIQSEPSSAEKTDVNGNTPLHLAAF